MQIYQFEITSLCNLNCDYCPNKSLRRPKQHMPIKVFQRVIDYSFMFNLACGHHFGEPLLHPELLYIAEKLRERELLFGFSTNAEILTLQKLDELIKAGLSWIKISFHSENSRKMFRKIKERYPALPLLASTLDDIHDWAGQVDIKEKSGGKTLTIAGTTGTISSKADCVFHVKNLGVIDSRGRILACCMDAHGISAMGSVYDINGKDFLEIKNDYYFSLCSRCQMKTLDIDREVRFYEKLANSAKNFIENK